MTGSKWLCDMKTPVGNLKGFYNQLIFELKPEFTTWLNTTTFAKNQKPVGYKILRAERTLSDRTIIAQGVINPMVVNYKHRKKESGSLHARKQEAIKMPSLTRTFSGNHPILGCNNYSDLAQDFNGGPSNLGANENFEGFGSKSGNDHRAQTWQFTQLMQMHSPEILFTGAEVDSSHVLRICGLAAQTEHASWSAELNVGTRLNDVEAKFRNGINAFSPGVSSEPITGEPLDLMDKSLFGPTNAENHIPIHQIYRNFVGVYYENNSTANETFNLYGTPEVSERGAAVKAYNGDFELRYTNSLVPMLIDDFNEWDEVNDDSEQQIYGVNSYGAKCVTFATETQTSIEWMYGNTGIVEDNGVLIAEFKKNNNALYLGGIYGGNSYESKSISSYLEIGTYNDIGDTSIFIESPGDTFVQAFTFTRISKTDTETSGISQSQITEVISIPVETSVDLKNRNDLSISGWENKWQPRYEEFQDYNRVYSQEPTLLQTTDEGFKFKPASTFDTKIITTKPKLAGEFIESWSDYLENETMELDGKYGSINATVNWRDEIFVFQDSGVALIRINPRVQTQGVDGISLELGVGGILHDYKYITTDYGCVNKNSIVQTEKGIYWYDLLHNSIMFFNGQLANLSDQQGFHNFFQNEINYTNILQDNPVNKLGVSVGHNIVNGDVYFTFLQDEFTSSVNSKIVKVSNNYTICFNEKSGSFSSFYNYTPAWYINKGNKMITSNPTSGQLWEHFKGLPGNFYGVQYNPEIVFNVSPSGSNDYSYDNLEYEMEMKDVNGNDLRDNTLTSVQLYNEYQDSKEKILTIRQNIRRRGRKWSITLPRDYNDRARIRSPWSFLKLKLDNDDGKRMTLHNLIVSYTEH